jgi:hypothetical protein
MKGSVIGFAHGTIDGPVDGTIDGVVDGATAIALRADSSQLFRNFA